MCIAAPPPSRSAASVSTLTISSAASATIAHARRYALRTQSSRPFFVTVPICAAMAWITASIGMTSSVSQPSSYVVVEPITASVVGSLSEAPATIPAPKLAPCDVWCLRRIVPAYPRTSAVPARRTRACKFMARRPANDHRPSAVVRGSEKDEAMADDTPPAEAPESTPPLTVTQFPDGTGHVGIARGWTAQTLGQGSAVLRGPDEATVELGISIAVLDPRGTLHQQTASMGLPSRGLVIPYVPDPAQALVAVAREIGMQRGQGDPQMRIEAVQALQSPPGSQTVAVAGTETRNATPWRFQGVVSLFPPGPGGSWSLGLNLQSAPAKAFARHAPAMMAMANSCVLDFEARRKQLGLAEGAVKEFHVTTAANPQPASAQTGAALTETPFPDGTGRIGVANGWSATMLGGGCAVLVRADGAQVSAGVSIRALDPRGSAYQAYRGLVLSYVADPAQAFVAINRALMMQGGQPDPEMRIVETTPSSSIPGAAYVSATYRKKSVLRRVRGTVCRYPPMQTGEWMLSGNLVSAPDATFDKDEPVLLAMLGSFSAGNEMAEQTAAPNATAPPSLEQSRKDQAGIVARATAERVKRRSVADTSTTSFIGGMFHSD